MFNMRILRKLLGASEKAGADDDTQEPIPRYPPLVSGVEYVPASDLLLSQHALVTRLRISIGVAPEMYEHYYEPVLLNYADYVQLLPASESHHHKGVGGLLRHGLEVAWNASELYSGIVMSPEQNSEKRRQLEPQWRFAVFVAALCHDVGKAAYDITVTNRDGTIEWDPGLSKLGWWLCCNQVRRYFVHWARTRKHNTHNLFSLTPLALILTPEVGCFLSRRVREAMQHAMLGVVDGDACAQTIQDIVKRADSLSVESDLRKSGHSEMSENVAVPVSRHVVDAMRRLVSSKRWRINKPGGRVWVSKKGVFVIWKKAAEEIRELLLSDNVPGIPADPDVLAKILLEQNIAKSYIDPAGAEQPYWPITPVLDTQTASLRMLAINLRQFDILSSDSPPCFCQITIPGYEAHSDDDKERPGVEEKPSSSVETMSAEDLLSQVDAAIADDDSDEQVVDGVHGDEKNVASLPEPLSQVVSSLVSNDALGDMCFLIDQRLYFLYPQSLRYLDDKPVEILGALADCIITDPSSPLVKTHSVMHVDKTCNTILIKPPYDSIIASQFLGVDIEGAEDSPKPGKDVVTQVKNNQHDAGDGESAAPGQDALSDLRAWLCRNRNRLKLEGNVADVGRKLLSLYCKENDLTIREVVSALRGAQSEYIRSVKGTSGERYLVELPDVT